MKVSFRCLHYLPAAILEDQGGPLTWRLHTKFYNFTQSTSTDILTLGQHTHLKLGELSSLFIVYNQLQFLDFCHYMVFDFIYCATMHTLQTVRNYSDCMGIWWKFFFRKLIRNVKILGRRLCEPSLKDPHVSWLEDACRHRSSCYCSVAGRHCFCCLFYCTLKG